MGSLRPNTPAQSGCLTQQIGRPLMLGLEVQEAYCKIVGILGKYPNLCSSIVPFMSLPWDYAPDMVLRICLAVTALAPSRAPAAAWDEILEYAQDLDLDGWPELLDAATMALKMSSSDYDELVQAFKELDRLSLRS